MYVSWLTSLLASDEDTDQQQNDECYEQYYPNAPGRYANDRSQRQRN